MLRLGNGKLWDLSHIFLLDSIRFVGYSPPQLHRLDLLVVGTKVMDDDNLMYATDLPRFQCSSRLRL